MHKGFLDAAKGKYWAVEVRGAQVLIRAGKARAWEGKALLDGNYKCKLKVEKSEEKALAYAEKQIAATTKKGFEEIGISEQDPAIDSLDFRAGGTNDVFFFLDRQEAGKLLEKDVQDLLRQGSSETVATLVAGGLDLPPKTIVAAAQGDKTGTMVQSLLDAGADPDFVGSSTALGIAAQKGHVKTVEVLLQAGANVNLADNNGGTPAMNAVLGNGKALDTLLAQKPNLSATSGSGRTALQIAIDEALEAKPAKQEARLDLARALVNAGSPVSAEQAAVLKKFDIEVDARAADPDQSLLDTLLGAWKVDYVQHGRIRRTEDLTITFGADGTFSQTGAHSRSGKWELAGSTVFFTPQLGETQFMALRGNQLVFRDFDEEHAQNMRYYLVKA